jgi:hypothetical protein
VDLARYKELAETNTANAEMNRAAATLGHQPALNTKRHSHYAEAEFVDLINYLRAEPFRHLRGVIFVDGDVLLAQEARLSIVDGALIVHGDMELTPGTKLEVRHSDTSRTLPGIVITGQRNLLLEEAVTIVDGLIFADGDVHVLGGVLDVAGALLAQNYLARGGTAMIKYQPEMLSTLGLDRTGRGAVELLSWQVLP